MDVTDSEAHANNIMILEAYEGANGMGRFTGASVMISSNASEQVYAMRIGNLQAEVEALGYELAYGIGRRTRG